MFNLHPYLMIVYRIDWPMDRKPIVSMCHLHLPPSQFLGCCLSISCTKKQMQLDTRIFVILLSKLPKTLYVFLWSLPNFCLSLVQKYMKMCPRRKCLNHCGRMFLRILLRSKGRSGLHCGIYMMFFETGMDESGSLLDCW